MDSVLCLDISQSPATVAVVGVEGKTVTVLEERTVPLSDALSWKSLSSLNFAAPKNGQGPEHTPPANDASPFQSIGAAIESLKSEWTNAVLIVPMAGYLSLNLPLPFADRRSLDKVLDLEVQDVIPFEVEDFVVSGRAVAVSEGGKHDVHVSLAPKQFIKNLIELCRSIHIEPLVISTPCSALGVIPQLAPDYFGPDAAFVACREEGAYVCVSAQGTPRFDRVIMETSDAAALSTDLRMTILAVEKKYKVTCRTVYVDGPPALITLLRQNLGRPVELLALKEFVKNGTAGAMLPALAAVFARDTEPSPPLTNFRVREFSYRPDFAPLLQGLRRLGPLFGVVAASVIIALVGTYYLRELHLDKLKRAMTDRVISAVPSLAGKEGDVIQAFQSELTSLNLELQNLGSQNSLSAMEALAELSKDFSSQPGVTVNNVEIRPSGLSVEVTGPDYASGDRIERALRKRREIYCHIKKETGAGGPAAGSRVFTFELKVC